MIANCIDPTRETVASEPFAHITYQYFGLDPKTFYADKFRRGTEIVNLFEDKSTKFDIDMARLRFLASRIEPGATALDLGCGSGPYAVSIKRHCRVKELVGIDMDPGCIEDARDKYDRAMVFEIAKTLPFPDAYFDAVYSLDFFGHVEFRHKNDLIREISRVTKPGGLSLHVIESSDIDYAAIDPSNPDDSLFKYVTAEGHVGLESAKRLRDRWSARFDVSSIENATIFPFYNIALFLFDPSFDRDFRDILATFTTEQRHAAQVCLGFTCDYLKNLAREVDPDLLTPESAEERQDGDERGNIVSKIFRKPCGLVFLTAQKPL